MSEDRPPSPPSPEGPPPTEAPPIADLAGAREMLGPEVRALAASRYTPREKLGQGGMGEVWLVADRLLGREVARKALLTGRGTGSDRRERYAERLFREARLQSRLEHPAIVPVYGFGLDGDGEPFFTMRRVSGVTLAQALQLVELGRPEDEERYGRPRLLAALARVALTLQYAHERGVTHRDLKPANVMFGEYGEIYVLDWGLARKERNPDGTSSTSFGSSLLTGFGTAGYAAPEVLNVDLGPVGPHTDIYALGAILFEILTFEPFVPGKSLGEILDATLSDQDRRPSARRPDLDISDELDAICEGALALKPGERTASAREFHDQLQRHLDHEMDRSQRRKEALLLADEAAQATGEALTLASADAIEARKRAIGAIGRSLALDPDEPAALEHLVRLLETPPAFTPTEVAERLEQAHRDERRKAAFAFMAASVAGLTVATTGWIVLDMLDPRVTGLATVLTALSVVLGAWGARPAKGGTMPQMYALAAMGALNFMVIGRILGPLMFVPTLVTGAAVFAGLAHELRHRVGLAAILISSLVIPIVLELAGVLPASYSFDDGVLRLEAKVVAVAELPFMLLLPAALVTAIVASVAAAAIGRESLLAEERRQALQSWQLRQLVPSWAAEPAGRDEDDDEEDGDERDA